MSPDAAAILTNDLVRDYLLNYARSLIYTTSLNYATIIGIDCGLDLLEDGTVHKVKQISSYYFQELKFFHSSPLTFSIFHPILLRSYSLDLPLYPPISFHSPLISLTRTPLCHRVILSRL